MSIGQRISVMVVLAVLACMIFFGVYSEVARREELLGDAIEEAADVGATLDVVLNEMLTDRELGELAHLPDEISAAKRIFGLAVLDVRSGQMISSHSIETALPRVRSLAREALDRNEPIAFESWVGGTHIAAYAFPLRRGRHDVIGAAVVLRDLTYMERFIVHSRWRLLGVDVLLALIVMVVGAAAARWAVARPVAAVVEGVHRIGEGDLTHAIVLKRRDEIGRIANAINQLMSDLGTAREQIRRDLEERIQLEKSLEVERRIQHAQRLAAVGQIAASIAHEIGSPLHVIAGRARFAAGREDVGEMRENLEVIAKQSDRITRVLEQLLSVARRRAPRIEPVAIREVARDVVALLGPQAAQHGVALSLDAHAAGRTTGDPDALQQVLFNLVMNAIQVQPGGGRVEVVIDETSDNDSLGAARPCVVVEVRDRGPGVPMEHRERIFDAFATGRETAGGTGLGLVVVRGIVREHAGQIRVADNPGGGAVFRVSLPTNEQEGRSDDDAA